MRYRVKRADRAALEVKVGQILFKATDHYGLCNDDKAIVGGGEWVAVKYIPSDTGYFTIPEDDVEEIGGLRVNQSAPLRYFDVYLDGKQLEDCFAADDGTGEAVIEKKDDVRPRKFMVGPVSGNAGELVYGEPDGIICEIVTGKVEIKIQPFSDMTDQQIREHTERDYKPDKIYRIMSCPSLDVRNEYRTELYREF